MSKQSNTEDLKNTAPKYIAYYEPNHEFQEFDTFKEAEKFLIDYDSQDGIDEGTELGHSWIAEKTHISSVEKTDFKENYCSCGYTEECSCGKDGEEWPYCSDWIWVGNVKYLPLSSRPNNVEKALEEIDVILGGCESEYYIEAIERIRKTLGGEG